MFRSSKMCRFGAMALVLSLPGTALAGQKHPGFDRTMDDLRLAHALLQRTKEAQTVNGQQDEIDKESGAEGKKPHALPRIDPRMPWADRLSKSLKLLEMAQQDCRTEKD